VSSEEAERHRVVCHLGDVLEARSVTLTELSARTGITMANLSILKTGKARAIRFTTLTAICDAVGCTPADLFSLADH
jgi:putative transcriptional regulator